jgi:predicted helicase
MPGVEHKSEIKMDYSNAYKSTFTRILDKYRQDSLSQKQKGYKFELLMQRYLQTEPIFASSLSNVWLWENFFTKDQFGGKDVGIDLVTETTGPWSTTTPNTSST